MRSEHSIYSRLNVWLLSGVGLLLLLTGVVLAAVVGRQLAAEYDLSLLAQARALGSRAEQDPDGVEFEFTDDALPAFRPGPDAGYFQVWLDGEDGAEVLARSPSLAATDLPRRPLPAPSAAPYFADYRLPDGRAGRLVQLDFLPALDQPDEEDGEDAAMFKSLQRRPAQIVVARERGRLERLLTRLRLTLLGAGLIVMVLVVLLVRFAVGRGLRPLDDVRRQAAEFDADSLGVRLRPRERTVELDPMIDQFNALLARLETAFERERRFSADVAHELRTPLAELRSLADVGGRWPDDRRLVETFFNDVRDATGQMERVVVNLLALARSERGLDVIDAAPFDLVTLLFMAWKQAARDAGADARALTFRYSGPQHLTAIGGRDQWALILTNILNNAASHCPPDSSVTASLTAAVDDERTDAAGRLRVAIGNRAGRLDKDDLPRLFDRLWRSDSTRSGGHHAGLGLTLVNTYARQLGLRVSPRLGEDGWFTMTLEGPIAVPRPRPAAGRADLAASLAM